MSWRIVRSVRDATRCSGDPLDPDARAAAAASLVADERFEGIDLVRASVLAEAEEHHPVGAHLGAIIAVCARSVAPCEPERVCDPGADEHEQPDHVQAGLERRGKVPLGPVALHELLVPEVLGEVDDAVDEHQRDEGAVRNAKLRPGDGSLESSSAASRKSNPASPW